MTLSENSCIVLRKDSVFGLVRIEPYFYAFWHKKALSKSSRRTQGNNFISFYFLNMILPSRSISYFIPFTIPCRKSMYCFCFLSLELIVRVSALFWSITSSIFSVTLVLSGPISWGGESISSNFYTLTTVLQGLRSSKSLKIWSFLSSISYLDQFWDFHEILLLWLRLGGSIFTISSNFLTSFSICPRILSLPSLIFSFHYFKSNSEFIIKLDS